MIYFFRSVGFFTLLIVLTATTRLSAAEKIPGTLTVQDYLTSPIQEADIEVSLTRKGAQPEVGLAGEPVELLISGNIVATAKTGGNGRARLSYTPKSKGVMPFTVRVGESGNAEAPEAHAVLDVWERRSPILVVEMTAFMGDPSGEGPVVSWPGPAAAGMDALPDAADELGKVTQFYYNVFYVVRQDQASGSISQVNEQARQWLQDRKFPAGHILVLPAGPETIGARLDALQAAGWKTVKVGVGRTKAFAEAFLQRRLDAVMVPEPVKGEAPRKAKIAKEWKDVRKKL